MGASVAAIGLLTTIAIAVSVIAFSSVKDQFRSINGARVPSLVSAGELAIKSTELTIAASQLIDADQQVTRRKAFDDLSNTVLELLDAVESRRLSNVNLDQSDALLSAVQGFSERLSELDRLTDENLTNISKSSAMLHELFQVNMAMTAALAPEIDAAYRELTLSGNKAASDSATAVDRLLNEEIDSFRSLMSLQTEVSVMAGAVSSFLMLEDETLGEQFRIMLGRASLRIGNFSKPLRELGVISDETSTDLRALDKMSLDAIDMREQETYSRDSADVRSFLFRLTGLQSKIEKKLIQSVNDKFHVMSLNAQKAATDSKNIISELLNVQMVQVRSSLEAVSTLRHLTSLAVQGALSNDLNVVDKMQADVSAILLRLEELISANEIDRVADSLVTLRMLVGEETGVVPLRKYVLRVNGEVDGLVAKVHAETQLINQIIRDILIAERASISSSSAELREKLDKSTTALIALGIVALVGTLMVGVFIIHRGIVDPLSKLIDLTHTLANGNLNAEIEYTQRTDELGQLAKALVVFRENALEKIRVENASENARREVEKERAANESSKSEQAKRIQAAVDALGFGLKEQAGGNLTVKLDIPFDGHLDSVRSDFNQSQETLRTVISRVANNTSNINHGSDELRNAVARLADRTEQQASHIEDAAKTLHEITSKVKCSSLRAAEAVKMGDQSQEHAQGASRIVGQAIEAMGRIEQASQRISSIVSMIEEIAFQTNLLALNAGVEAARAGDAGLGFGVVAQEVRQLAQRAADAAKEIDQLISTSEAEVEIGVKLVQSTESSIAAIKENILTVNDLIESIAVNAKEQSDDLHEVNDAICQIDQMTQKNASMAQDTNSATQNVAHLATELLNMVSIFESKSGPGRDGSNPQGGMQDDVWSSEESKRSAAS